MSLSRILICVLLSSAAAAAQNAPPAPAPQQPSNYANYSILLVNPAGGAVALMHAPKGNLEFVDVAKTKEAFAAGYVPARAAEISEVIGALKAENEELQAENARLKTHPAETPEAGLNEINCHTYMWLKDATADQLKTCAALYPVPTLYAQPTAPSPSEAELAAQQRAQAEEEKANRRERLIETWMMMQNMNQPRTYNLNIQTSDCTRLPALCAGR